MLEVRKLYPESSLADLYNDTIMPSTLRKAHQANAKVVILGNSISAAKVLLTVIESPYFIREKLFLTKLERFLNSI